MRALGAVQLPGHCPEAGHAECKPSVTSWKRGLQAAGRGQNSSEKRIKPVAVVQSLLHSKEHAYVRSHDDTCCPHCVLPLLSRRRQHHAPRCSARAHRRRGVGGGRAAGKGSRRQPGLSLDWRPWQTSNCARNLPPPIGFPASTWSCWKPPTC